MSSLARADFISFRRQFLNDTGAFKRELTMDEIREQNRRLVAVEEAERGCIGHSDSCQFFLDAKAGFDHPLPCTCGYDQWKDDLYRESERTG